MPFMVWYPSESEWIWYTSEQRTHCTWKTRLRLTRYGSWGTVVLYFNVYTNISNIIICESSSVNQLIMGGFPRTLWDRPILDHSKQGLSRFSRFRYDRRRRIDRLLRLCVVQCQTGGWWYRQMKRNSSCLVSRWCLKDSRAKSRNILDWRQTTSTFKIECLLALYRQVRSDQRWVTEAYGAMPETDGDERR